MKLDRNIPDLGRGKYALIKLRVPNAVMDSEIHPHHQLVDLNALDYGDTADSDFFVIRLKDKYAAPALAAYAMAAYQDDPEYGLEMLNLAKLAAEHPSKRIPD